MMDVPLVDYHCHVDLYPNFEQLIEECEESGIYTTAVTTTPKAWPRNKQLCEGKKFVRAALGLHPQLVAERAAEVSLWLQYLPEARFVGEVGLDAGPAFYKSFEHQKQIFQFILEECNKLGNRILSIHSVRSATKVIEMLFRHLPNSNCKTVLHWFSGDMSSMRRAIEFGCYFSVNMQMIHKADGGQILRSIPIDRLLTETDGPFTRIGGNIAKPTAIHETVSALATILHVDVTSLKKTIVSNMHALESPLH